MNKPLPIHIKKGLDVKLDGLAELQTLEFPAAPFYYIRPSDFRWLTPRLLVAENDPVEVGTPLFADKQDERVVVVSPVRGCVRQIVRGAKRAILALVIESETSAAPFRIVDVPMPSNSQDARTLMMQYGLWPMLRQRPFSVIPNPDAQPKAVFILCFDSAPLAPDYNQLMEGKEVFFQNGLKIIRMAAGNAPLHLCVREGADNSLFERCEDVQLHYFQGPHPAGNVGTQIHYIDPIAKGETVWFADPQDVALIGRFFAVHELSFEKMIALTGPAATTTGYFTASYGADLTKLFKQEWGREELRIISGNVLTGAKMEDFPTVRFYDRQVTILREGGQREWLGWLLPGFRKWSFSHTFLAWLFPRKSFAHNTSLHGGRRTFMMTDVYDKVFPFDIIPLSLLKACYIKDLEQMEALGIYEVDDEDFALCEVVCPSKMECQQIVRDALYELKMNS